MLQVSRSFLQVSAALALCLSLSQPAARAASTLIEGVTLISAERDAPLTNAWVLIENDRIAGLGQGHAPAADVIVDAAGRYLIPGLIDSHVHLYHATGLKRRYTETYEALQADFFAQQPRSFLYHGFTTVIELNADFASNDRFTSVAPHPRLFHCSKGAVLQDGFLSLEVEGPLETAYPGYFADHYAAGTGPVAGHTPEDAVRRITETGGICVKAYYEEALWWPRKPKPDFALPSREIMRDLVTAAHAHDLPVILHATSPAGHRFALETGIDILAHGMWEWPGQRFDASEPKPAYEQIARAVARSPLGLQPTFTTIGNTRSLFTPELLADPAWTKVVPERYRAYLASAAAPQRQDFETVFGPLLKKSAPGRPFRDLQSDFNTRYERLIGGMAKEGANLLFGTDTAVGGFGFAAPPGLAGYWEMKAWRRAGIPLQTLFRALTLDNARAFHLDDRLGSIEPGKAADLLLLRQNPLETVEAYDTIELVVLGGEVLARDSLATNN
ncbi:amidohydrolase family protein [Labrenzia sp. VG12]|uniref:amidohydrolase family protein n=1 Tax=Labrenzia sp. VG12 TaxID=2021862 RepID=UPI0018DF8C37|nr:amidohydrolase family protein [Labrenzia sp. VG12]